LFETRRVEKIYLAMTDVEPKQAAWTCRLLLGPHPEQHGLMRVDKHGKEAETAFGSSRVRTAFILSKRGRRRGGSIRFASTWRNRVVPSLATSFTGSG